MELVKVFETSEPQTISSSVNNFLEQGGYTLNSLELEAIPMPSGNQWYIATLYYEAEEK